MKWLKEILRWLDGEHIEDINELKMQADYHRRMWESTQKLNVSLSAALKDCAEASLQETAKRDAEIQALTVRLTVATASHGPLVRYINAVNTESFALSLVAPVEALKIGIYRSKDKTQLYAAEKALGEAESVGWELLGTDEAVLELRRCARRVMGVWN